MSQNYPYACTKCSSDQEIKKQLYMNAHIILVQIGTCILMKDWSFKNS